MDMHSTSEEAAFSLTFTGMAVYVYGHAPQVNYWYNVNYIGRFLANPDPKVGLLFSATDLNYSTNVITCQSGVGGMTITGFIITVGMPLSDNGTKVQTRNVSAFTNDGTLNPVFTTNDPYWGNSTYNDGEYLSIGSSTLPPHSNTTAFAMYGALGSEDGEYTVLVSPDVSLGQTLNTQFNASSQWRAVDQLKYLATNMNSSLSYKVDILNNGQYSHSQFELSNFVLYGFSPSM
ncbi:hypothetical protein A0H81_07946 [Grifola frondosa]|uniref:Uncharacterized protein n=1 Tax=Grifola frondosa TaxID=5627 RepID=A0A1C7M6T8_GRIFR|nr:hypothetical protein A0H81_07946 [Grifola frondosa]